MTTHAPLVGPEAARTTETPNAVMTTLASPTLGPTAGLSLWEVAMDDGQQGPVHAFDAEQVWHVVEGELAIDAGGAVRAVPAGASVVLPAGVDRQVTARGRTRAIVAGHGTSRVQVPGEATDRGTPPWVA